MELNLFFFFLVNGCEEKAVAWHETTRCVPLTVRYGFGRMFAYSWAGSRYMFHMCVPADVRMARLLQSAVVQRGEGSSREGALQVAAAVLCLSLGRKPLSALRRNKSFIWFVVFLTEGSRSRNKVLLSILSALIFSLLLSARRHVLPDAVVRAETRVNFHRLVEI